MGYAIYFETEKKNRESPATGDFRLEGGGAGCPAVISVFCLQRRAIHAHSVCFSAFQFLMIFWVP